MEREVVGGSGGEEGTIGMQYKGGAFPHDRRFDWSISMQSLAWPCSDALYQVKSSFYFLLAVKHGIWGNFRCFLIHDRGL